MVICNYCGKTFADEDSIPLLIQWNGATTLLKGGAKDGTEVFRGCPCCLTDEYLMDIDEEDLKEKKWTN